MKTTICPTDFSLAAANAVTYATTFCKHIQSDLVFVLKQSASSLFIHPQQAGQMAAAGPTSAVHEHRAAAEYRYQADPVNQIQQIFGIAQAARIEHAGLIATGVDKEFGYNDIYNQSLSNLVTQARCPALLIPEGISFTPLKKIVLVIDHECNISHRLDFIASLAETFGAEILFLQVNTQRNWIIRHPLYESFMDMYLAFPYEYTSFHEVVNECIPEAIRSFTEKVQADLVITVSDQLNQLPYTQATSLHYNEFSAHPLRVPLLALDVQSDPQMMSMMGYPFN